MNQAAGIIGRIVCVALGLQFVSPQTVGFSQCPAAPPPLPPSKKLALDAPKERICCIFNWALALNPKELTGHVYGNGGDTAAARSQTPEPVGYVYTAAAGLVDIGHVRDNADMTLWVYANLLSGARNFNVGNDTVAVASIPASKDQMVALAAAIVYVGSWAHELVTWGDSPYVTGGAFPDAIAAKIPQEDFSAFSPEDLSSNIVGIVTATRAIALGGDASPKAFSEKMDIALPAMMTELGALEADKTTGLLNQIQFAPGDTDLKGKWWMKNTSAELSNFGIRLLRRNFDGAAWKIANAPVQDTPGWMATTNFSKLYGQFLYLMSIKIVADTTQVPLTTDFALGNKSFLTWVPITAGAIPTAATLAQGLGGSSCVLAKGSNQPLGAGQFGTVNVNVWPQGSEAIIANMQDATDAISKAFVNENSCVPGTPCTLPAGAQDAGLMNGP